MRKLIKRCHMVLCVLSSILLCYSDGNLSSAADVFSSYQSLSDGQTLTSVRGRFKLGFFSASNSSSTRYVGIWYNLPGPDRVIVWVANREHPVLDSSGVLKIDGASTNLVLVDGQERIIWSTHIISNNSNAATSVPTAKLMDSGELVLLQSDTNIMWSSFNQLTDTFLPKSELFLDRSTNSYNTLTSWKSKSDPSPGSYSVGFLSSVFDQSFLWVNGSKPYWRTGPWIGQKFIGIPEMPTAYLKGFELNRAGDRTTFRFVLYNESDVLTRIVLDPGGQLADWWWDDGKKEWELYWKKPEDQCDLYGTCGEFALCDSSSSPICSCMRGFQPRSSEDWARGNWSGGCVRVKQLECLKNQSENSSTSSDGFFKLERLKLPDSALWYDAYNETYCMLYCSEECPCLAYAYVGGNCMLWDKGLLDMMIFQVGGEDLHIKLNPSELDHVTESNSSGGNKKKKYVVIIVVVIIGTSVIGIIFLWTHFRQQEKLENDETCNECIVPSHAPILGEQEPTDDFSSSPTETKGLDFLLFDMQIIVTATDDFSESNKLGEGGFGPVYKGVLPGGLEIAVKRLSARSRQGLKEFKAEVSLISKLQHRNLVRLLGYCINAEEKLLIYEYMPNNSLDAFLFGAQKENPLDWSKRLHIIEGIAQGLLYLHRDSRLRIVHRDLKASNILLDADFNPKISDFGTARIFDLEQILETNTIVGTQGYMSPEYALQGHFTEKSDVYSFGVLLLEIISGARITSFYDEQYHLNLLGFAWKLWKEGNGFDLVDLNTRHSWPQSSAMNCITVALLCVQELAADRPTMSSIVSMLTNDSSVLPTPKEPTFIGQRAPSNSNSSEGRKQCVSACGVTSTELDAR